ncbi:MAG: DNA gyrase subunit A [Alphaproteobacteria bacterium MarineAlpha5_Bin11]|nr:DNA gyrase subunit A [Pelagibacteraceae bacterium]PPR44145.1 MAG: DNA gyrase subunit A [Alphaproteobacteria bacterium MarineAlpha5_Bin11]|tara:strand:- start:7769 stop:10435 length:2667 start_codon:yes stop_codon:yes gene_type:complete
METNNNDLTSNNISNISLEDEMRKSYLDYAMSVIVSRALPDVRDGLKPVHRRILYSMNESGYNHNKNYRKSARIVGDVMGKFHPHGDAAIYESMVRMAQNFSMRLELIDGQGNFGSVDGDPPAAMRYTEAKLAKVSEFLVQDLDKETVEFKPNYDDTDVEPAVLPAKFPNLLVNGAGGIAVGMATNIPPHNLGEVIDATIFLINNPNSEIRDLNNIIKGPDFPTGAIIVGTNGIENTYNTGKGSSVVRSKTSIETMKNNKESIVVNEIPYQQNKSKLLERIAETVNNKIIDGISDIRDESDRDGVRVVIELKRDAESSVVLNQLYKHTPLQSTFSSNILALNQGKPEQLNLKEILESFINFRKDIITKRTIYDLNKAREKAHILIGFVIANDNIDKVIEIIKKSKDSNEAKKTLLSIKWKISKEINKSINILDANENDKNLINYSLTEEQVKSILEMRLYKLTSFEREDINNNLISIKKEISNYLEILNSNPKLLKVIIDELSYIRNEFATDRKTQILNEEEEISDKIDLIQKEDIVITISHRGYLKRVPLTNYKSQKRGGKGKTGMSMRDNDFVSQLFVASTHTKLLIFSSLGKVYSLKSYEIPEGSPISRGKPIINFLPFKNNEVISAVVPLPVDENEWSNLKIIFLTSNGMIRKNFLNDVAKSGSRALRGTGKTAIKLNKDDILISVNLCNDKDDVLLSTTDGKCIRFPISKIRLVSGLNSKGVRGIRLKNKNKVISMTMLKHSPIDLKIRQEYLKNSSLKRKDQNFRMKNEEFTELNKNEEFILSVTNKGFAKRSSAYEYRVTGRGGVGITGMLITSKNGKVVDSFPVMNEDEIILVTDGGKIIRIPIKDVRIAGRTTKGVSVFKVSNEEKIVSVSKVSDLENL